jgi:hypothetical protein
MPDTMLETLGASLRPEEHASADHLHCAYSVDGPKEPVRDRQLLGELQPVSRFVL